MISSQSVQEHAITMSTNQIPRAWRALMAYRSISLHLLDAQAAIYASLPPTHQHLLSAFPVRLSHAAEAVETNADIAERIANQAVADAQIDDPLSTEHAHQTHMDFENVVDALLSIAVDWSAIGEKQRMHTYDPVVNAVRTAADAAVAARRVSSRQSYAVLVPGAGVGRLAWEIANLGCAVQGVESSYLRLVVCSFVLNSALSPKHATEFYPFVHETGAVDSVDEQLKCVQFPDVDPACLKDADFSMVAGEFLDLYNEDKAWDCIVTCFCIEDCHSIISFVRRIAKVLKTGGTWINHGSLQFRYDDAANEPSVEITAEELACVIERCGLRVVRNESMHSRPVCSGSLVREEISSLFITAVRD